MMNNNNLPECEQGFWLIAYDLRSSRAKGVNDADRAWVESQRVKIWTELRYKYKCTPIQESLWKVRNPEMVERLRNQLEIWRKLYEARGYPVRLTMLPVRTNDEGFKSFKDMELDFLLSWITKIHKQLDKAIQTHKITKKQLKTNDEKIALVWDVLKEDFADNERFQEASALVLIAQDKIATAKKYA